MSQAKMAQVFPPRKVAGLDKILMSEISKILRSTEAQPSLRKRLGLQTGLSPRTIQKWCDGKNVPSLSSYIHLARYHPGLVDLFINLCQRKPKRLLADRHHSDTCVIIPTLAAATDGQNHTRNVPNNVPNQIDTSACNIRQLWFISSLLDGEIISAEEIATYWRVTRKTAKRDIASLRLRGLIMYVGSRRNGKYQLR